MFSLAELLVTYVLVLVRLSQSLVCSAFSFKGSTADQVDSLSLRKVGPSIHTSLSARSLTERPLVGKSAGFSVPGMCRHWSGLVVFFFDWQQMAGGSLPIITSA